MTKTILTTTQVRPRLTSLQMLRGLAAIMVLLFHVGVVVSLPTYWNAQTIRLFFTFGRSGVEIFFVLSGFLMLFVHGPDLSPPAFVPYIKKRFSRIYPVYWLVLAILTPIYFLVPALGGGFERDPNVLLSSIVLVHLGSSETVLAVAWTLFHEIMFYALFSILFFSRRLGIAALGLWFVSSCYSLLFSPHNTVLYEYLSPLHLLFGFGLCVSWLCRRWPLFHSYLLTAVGLATFSLCCIGQSHAMALFTPASPQQAAPGDLMMGLSAALLMWGLVTLDEKGRFSCPSVFLLLGDASYSIYLVHLAALSVAAKLLRAVLGSSTLSIACVFAMLVLSGLCCGILFHLIVERPLLRRLKKG